MRFRVAIPLIAAICLGSPVLASPTIEEQMVKGRGARDRSSGSSGGSTAERGAEPRRSDTRVSERREEPRVVAGGPEPDQQRRAVPRDDYRPRGYSGDGRGRDDRRPVIVTRNRPDININIGGFNNRRFYAPVHYDYWARQYYRWSPIGYAPWSLIYGSIGLSNFGYYGHYGSPGPYYYGHNGYYGPGAYSGPWQHADYDTGRVRLKVRPRYAEVYVDGHYAGLVDDFDGTFQSLRLPAGGHKIEIHLQGYEDLEIDVHVQPGRTLTLAEDLRPRP
jgi:hypothetical protein